MKEISEIYKMSKDYKRLYDLVLAGYRIPCIVDYRMSMHYRDYAKVFKFENSDTIIISSRGIEYGGWDKGHKHSFVDLCEFLNLEWFDTHESLIKQNEDLKKEVAGGCFVNVYDDGYNRYFSDKDYSSYNEAVSNIDKDAPYIETVKLIKTRP